MMKMIYLLFFFKILYVYCVAYKGDILCLQEVESHVFSKELYPILNKYMGMDGVYLKKSGNKSEGLSCFYSTNKFKYVTQFFLILYCNIHISYFFVFIF